MSHYRVAVFSDSPDDQSFMNLLAPYSEVDKKYFVEERVSDEALAECRKEYEADVDTERTFEEWLVSWYGYQFHDGAWYSSHNPNAKWDWYTLDGGEWQFPLRKKVRASISDDLCWPEERFRMLDYSYAPERGEKTEAAKFWDYHVEGKPVKGMEGQRESLFNSEYYRQRYGTKKNYVKASSINMPYAFITPDGKWHAPGVVSWFALDSATPESLMDYVDEWIAYLDSGANPYVSFVDCHI